MTTVQLRHYQLPSDPQGQDQWIEWWRGLVGPREDFGFRILFAYLDRETGEFTWAVSHDRDLAAVEAEYNQSPKRLEVMSRPRPECGIVRVAVVDVVA